MLTPYIDVKHAKGMRSGIYFLYFLSFLWMQTIRRPIRASSRTQPNTTPTITPAGENRRKLVGFGSTVKSAYKEPAYKIILLIRNRFSFPNIYQETSSLYFL